MQKIAVFAVGAVLLGASVFAVPVSASSCVSLSSNMAYGQRSSEVRTLQSYLVDQNYPGGGSWMITGLYGAATQVAVKMFQQQHGLTQSGIVDAQTRAALNCGYANSSYNYNYSSSNTYSYPNVPVYTAPITPTPIVYSYPYTGTPMLNSLSVNTGGPGTSVIVYGSNFDYSSNTVYVGSQSLGAFSSNGTTISFVIPSNVGTGNVNIRVANAYGTSNSLAFNVLPYVNLCSYPYIYSYNTGTCGCAAYGTCNTPNNLNAPTISYVSPAFGTVGTSVTVFGTGFSTTGNTVHFGQGIIANLGSADGRSVSFVVPANISGYGATQTTLGNYTISVTNSAGYTTGAVQFTVTALANGATNTFYYYTR